MLVFTPTLLTQDLLMNALSFFNVRIYEKLVVHSDLMKAASWKRLTEEFLNSPLPATEGTKV